MAYRLLVNYAEEGSLLPDWITGTDLVQFTDETKKAAKGQLEMLIEMLEVIRAECSKSKPATGVSGNLLPDNPRHTSYYHPRLGYKLIDLPTGIPTLSLQSVSLPQEKILAPNIHRKNI